VCGDGACNGAETDLSCPLDCSNGEICGDGVPNAVSTPTTALVSFTGANCTGSPGDVTVTLNGTSYGPFLATVGCAAGVAPQRIFLNDPSVYEQLIDGVNTFSFVSTNTGIHWAKIRFNHTGETFVFTEQGAGDAVAEALLPAGPVPPLANATITPSPTFVAAEQCDDGNLDNGDGCDAQCRNETNGFCGDGDPNSPGRNDATSVVFSWAAVDCDGTENYDVTLAINGVDVATVLGTQGCVCGGGVQRYTVTDPTVLASLTGSDDTFELRAANGGNTVWAKVEVFTETNPTGDAFVFYERLPGDAAAESPIPCGGIDYPVLDFGLVVGDPDVKAPFACDDGNLTDGDGCDANCTITGCGNGVQTAGEFCDEGAATASCDIDCTAPACGDGLLNVAAGEGCDDGNLTDGDGCNALCQTEFCGDSIVQAALGEDCDDGNNINNDGCNFVCRDEVCGDGVLHAGNGEACDDGNLTNGDGCSDMCQPECGNGLTDGAGGPITSVVVEWVGFVCNDANQFTLQIDGEVVHQQSFPLDFAPGTCFCNGSAPIRSYAITDPKVIGPLQAGRHDLVFSGRSIGVTWARLVINGTETYPLFDPSNVIPTQDSCSFQTNGSVDRTVAYYREACDGGAGCNALCELAACGDGNVAPTEECDDANLIAGDGCDAFCMLESCGNGVQDSGEECDDGGLVDGDGCSSVCRVERCGNGITDGLEDCDDGNLIAGDGCDELCIAETCGNGVTDVGEQCDGGAGCSAGCTILGCVPGTDSDGDRLDDCVETNTGIYVSLSDTGTSALLADSDGDGISDGDEVLGTLGGLNLPAFGVSPNRIDILVEIDWTGSAVCANPTTAHRIADWEAELLDSMFRNAPVTNRDGSRGIHLYLDYGQSPAHTGGNYIDTTDDFLDGGVGGADYVMHKAANFASERNGYFHYSLAARQFNVAGNSGQAELFGDDMIITPGCGASLFRAGTYAHELGHNLGLGHGGFENCNDKPNYVSIMNYRHTGLDVDCDGLSDGFFAFSSGTMLSIDENAINEADGLCGEPFDFNNNGVIDPAPYALDLNAGEPNQAGNCGGTLSTLVDHDDWLGLSHTGISDNDGRGRRVTEVITCDPEPTAPTPWIGPQP
jgi:cysteine-rich repeat protein